jgi:uncharacterized protein (TIGR02145 family)
MSFLSSDFSHANSRGHWWSANESDRFSARALVMQLDSDGVSWWKTDKTVFFSIRCVED